MKDLIYKTVSKIRGKMISSKSAEQTTEDLEDILTAFAKIVINNELNKTSKETGKEAIIRLTELNFCKKDIERISGKSRQYVHKVIKEQYAKNGR